MFGRTVAARGRDPEDDDDEDREHQQSHRVVGEPGLEAHYSIGRVAGADDDCEPEDEKTVREDRADQRGLGDDDLSRVDRKEDDEELRQIPERRLEKPGDAVAQALAQRLGGESDHPGNSGERCARDRKGEDGRRIGIVEDPGERAAGRDRSEDQALGAGQAPMLIRRRW